MLSWNVAIRFFIRMLFKYRFSFIEAFCGSYLTIEAAVCLKTYFNSFGCSNIYYVSDYVITPIADILFS